MPCGLPLASGRSRISADSERPTCSASVTGTPESEPDARQFAAGRAALGLAAAERSVRRRAWGLMHDEYGIERVTIQALPLRRSAPPPDEGPASAQATDCANWLLFGRRENEMAQGLVLSQQQTMCGPPARRTRARRLSSHIRPRRRRQASAQHCGWAAQWAAAAATQGVLLGPGLEEEDADVSSSDGPLPALIGSQEAPPLPPPTPLPPPPPPPPPASAASSSVQVGPGGWAAAAAGGATGGGSSDSAGWDRLGHCFDAPESPPPPSARELPKPHQGQLNALFTFAGPRSAGGYAEIT